ncbi:trimethylamine methyltransferase family protein [Ruminococcus sp. OA3]|uniref:trimethylamine methyltransferase family protein n=1 Tax=Ruminococcus sp. OA3 TaxID=2914164 RepID=UPI001F050DEB|nr:trimethylamine methyltransferase family protein [Ruminococcus sp. OA3]MCH1981300.1 trimethylamine methyltransferase family protein [Ruminococcus sp. OA3]
MNFVPQLNYVSEEQIEKLHQYGMKILKNLGMRIEDPDIRKLLCEHGCTEKGDRICFTDTLIGDMLKAQKGRVTMTSAVTGMKKEMEIGKTFVHSTGGAPWIADMKTGKRRNGMLTDLIDTIRVMNQLPELDLPCALVYPSEIPSAVTQLRQTATMLKYSHKPIYGPGISLASNAKYIAELFKVYGGSALADNPIGMVGISPESPLFLPKEITDTMSYIVRAGIPVSILAAPMGGLTSPLSVAGTVAQAHAEILAFACVSYLMNPDCVLFYGSRTFFANMKNSQSILGLPETGISSALAVQLANHCGFLSDVYGLSCTSCAMDEQAGYEKMINAMLPGLAGATLITGFGSTASVMCCSLSQLVLDNEIIAMIRKAKKPFAITEDEMGFEALEYVIHDEETFLEQEHTIDHLHEEVFQPSIGFDSVWADWIKCGEVSLAKRAAERALELIQNDEVPETKPEITAEVEKILAAAEKELL